MWQHAPRRPGGHVEKHHINKGAEFFVDDHTLSIMANNGVLKDLPKEGKRWMVVGLTKMEYTEAEIKSITGMAHHWQREWNQRFAETGCLTEAEGKGRRTDREEQIAENKRHLKELIDDGGHEIASSRKLARYVDVKPRQVRNYLASGDISSGYAPFEEGIALDRESMQRRLHFAIANKRRSWKKVVFTDSKVFVGEFVKGTVKKWKAWHPLDGRRTIPTVKHGYQVHVYGAITAFGAVNLVLATGTTGQQSMYVYRTGRSQGQRHRGVCSREYQDILEVLIPAINDLFAENNVYDWTFQQDWAGAHKPQHIKDFITERCPFFLDSWPSRSPDLSPIENVWAIVEMELWDLGKEWNNLEEFTAAVHDAWNKVTQDRALMSRLVKGVKKRMEKVEAERGGPIPY